MWSPNTFWFDVAMVMTIFAVGSICFGRFEEHKPRGRRLVKLVLVLGVVLGLSAVGLRPIAYGLIAALGGVAAWVHLRWLPSHGINGWTAEPRDKYLDLMKERDARPRV